MSAIGALLILWGLADFGLSWMEIDIYYEVFNYYVPDNIYPFTAWIAMIIGGILFQAGKKK
jgi:hypothetical protein